jgi:hypothetical protein
MYLLNMKLVIFTIIITLILIIVSYIILYLKQYILFPKKNSFNDIIITNRIQNKPLNITLLANLSDKYIVKKKINELKIDNLFIPKTYYNFKEYNKHNLHKINDLKLKHNNFVIKPTHFSGVYYIYNKNNNTDDEIHIKNVFKTLKYSYNSWWKYILHPIIPLVEHHYDLIKPKIIVEEYIENNSEWKFYVYNNEVKFIYINYLFNNKYHTFFVDINFNLLQWKQYCKKQSYNEFNYNFKPKQWNDMIKISQDISTKLNFKEIMRVDLYLNNDKIYFSELTFTPAGGRGRFIPENIDIECLNETYVV